MARNTLLQPEKNLRSSRQPEVTGVGQAGDGHVEMGLVKLVGQEEQRSVQRASQVGAESQMKLLQSCRDVLVTLLARLNSKVK